MPSHAGRLDAARAYGGRREGQDGRPHRTSLLVTWDHAGGTRPVRRGEPRAPFEGPRREDEPDDRPLREARYPALAPIYRLAVHPKPVRQSGDRHQARILEALLEARHPRRQPHTEVAVRQPTRGWIDLALTSPGSIALLRSKSSRSSGGSSSSCGGRASRRSRCGPPTSCSSRPTQAPPT